MTRRAPIQILPEKLPVMPLQAGLIHRRRARANREEKTNNDRYGSLVSHAANWVFHFITHPGAACPSGLRKIEDFAATGYTRRVPNVDDKLAPVHVFLRRQFQHAAAAFLLVAAALGIGIAGYHWIAHEGWTDALLNASMILSGEGPVDHLETAAAKIFASAYALFGGVVFIITMGLILTPMVHRLLHRLHIEENRRRRTETTKPPLTDEQDS
jgi:hypothetical protein